MAWGFRQRPAQPYTQGDEISPMFTIVIRNPQGDVLPKPLHNWQSNETLVREASYIRNDDNGRFFTLTQIAPDTFQLQVNYETAEFTQQYRITADNKIVPLSFKSWNVGHAFILFILSFPLFALLKRLFRLPLRSRTPKAA